MTEKTPFYITTAISYVNGVPHLGHAYEVILTDVMARFQRLDGREVYFLTGTDEHGEKVAKTAEDNGMSPKEFADKNAATFLKMTDTLNISNNDFIRTSEDRHYKASQAIWKTLKDKGDIELGKYQGWYSIGDEAYFTEDELRTAENGDKFTADGKPVKWVEESSYFFKLSNYTEKLLEYYEAHPEFIEPSSRRNEIISFVKQEGGLKDLSVSRHKDRLKWGIPVPGDEDHVMYVWLDALTNYLTGIGYPDLKCDQYNTFWPADFHVIGKDIIRFHCIYWPAFLMAADLPLPKTVFAHGFINVHGEKMSKSIGNVLSPDGLVESFGLDQIRYFLMREIPHGQDGNFSHEQAVTRINADLANGLGNLAQRTLSIIHKNCDAKIPECGALTEEDKHLIKQSFEVLGQVREDMNAFKVHRALEKIWVVVSAANGYVDAQAPWALKNDNPERMKTVLFILAEVIRRLAILTLPVTPDASGKLLDQLKIPQESRNFAHINPEIETKSGVEINKPEGVFPRIVEPAANEGEAA